MLGAASRLVLVIAVAACQAPRPDAGRTSAGAAAPAPPHPAPARVETAAVGDSAASDSAARSVGAPAEPGADSAVAVLHGFYAAINARDYPRAYAAWANDGPPGHPTLAEFAKGYAGTDSVELSTGTPGPVEGAAGSRYVIVPVALRAFERGGRRTDFAGSYTLRRTVVPDAPPENRRWHLYRAALHARAAAERDPGSG
jgi:hypothetical protein